MSELNLDPTDSEGVRNLREALERSQSQNATLAEQAKRGAFFEAGVVGFDGTNPTAKLFFDSYTGELTPEAIKTAAEPYGVLQAPTPPPAVPPTTTATPEEVQAQLARQQLGLETIDPTVPPKEQTLKDAYNESGAMLQRGADRDESSTPVFGHLMGEAMLGKGYVFDPAKWNQDARESGAMNDLLHHQP